MSERESASERVLCVLGIKLMFQPLWLALVALQYYSFTLRDRAVGLLRCCVTGCVRAQICSAGQKKLH